jgi:hypothetical protein
MKPMLDLAVERKLMQEGLTPQAPCSTFKMEPPLTLPKYARGAALPGAATPPPDEYPDALQKEVNCDPPLDVDPPFSPEDPPVKQVSWFACCCIHRSELRGCSMLAWHISLLLSFVFCSSRSLIACTISHRRWNLKTQNELFECHVCSIYLLCSKDCITVFSKHRLFHCIHALLEFATVF